VSISVIKRNELNKFEYLKEHCGEDAEEVYEIIR
jgi:hypothetical protein